MSYFPTTKHTYANVTVPNGGYTGNITLTGGSGSVLYSTGTATNWAASGTNTLYYNKQPKVKITEDDIEVDGLSLRDTLRTMHERMAIMVPNPALEREFEELRACADRYRELEQEFTEQLKMWNTLKSTDR